MSDDQVFCRPCTCERCRRNYTDKFCSICCFESGNAFIDELIANSFDDLPNSSDHPPQHQTHSFESYNDNPNYGYPPQEPFIYNQDSCYEQNFVDNSQSPPQPQYETNSYKVIKSSVEDLVPIPSDVPFSDKNHFDVKFDLIESLLTRDTLIVYSPKIDSLLEEFVGELIHIDPIPSGINETDFDLKYGICFIEQLLYDDTSSEDNSFKDIDYVEASPPDSKLVSLKEVQEDILRAKLLNIHLLIAKIESFNNNPTPDCVLKSPSSSFLSYTNNSSPEFKTFSYHTEETSSGSTTTYANNSLPEYVSFLFENEPDQGELTSVVMNDIPNNLTNDPLIEEIDLFLALDNSIPSGIENVDYDSEGDILFLEELLRKDSLLLPEFETFHFDLYDEPSSPRPPEKPLDDGGILTTKVVDDISDNSTRELYVHVLNVFPSQPTLCLNIDTLLPFHPKIRTKFSILEARIFLSRVSCLRFRFRIAPDLEASRARGFVHRPLEL
nr:hypothetical protein [Tanacetum cinerariifolium]